MTIRTSRGARPDVGHAGPGREAQALGLGPGVADHERRDHRGGGEDDGAVESRELQGAPRGCRVDDALAPAVEVGVHERAELADLAGRPGERRRRTGRTRRRTRPAARRGATACSAGRDRRDAGDAGSRSGSGALGDRPEPAEADGDRRHQAADARPGLRGDERAAHETACPAPVTPSRPRARDWRVGERLERLGDDGVDGLAALAARRHEPDLAKLAQVPRHERLRQPDVLDQLRDGRRAVRQAAARCAAGWRRRGPCGTGAARAGRRGCRRPRRSCSGFGRAWGTRVIGDLRACRVVDAVGSTAVHINGD